MAEIVQKAENIAKIIVTDLETGAELAVQYLGKEAGQLLKWGEQVAASPVVKTLVSDLIYTGETAASVLVTYEESRLGPIVPAVADEAETLVANLISASGLGQAPEAALTALGMKGISDLEQIAQAAISQAFTKVVAALQPPTLTPTPAAAPAAAGQPAPQP